MRTPEAKALRRQAILDAARAIFAGMAYAEIRVQDIVSATGLAKGTFYLYFQSKESLFLALLLDELKAWFDELELQPAGLSEARLARLLTDTLVARPLLRRLLGLLHNVLEAGLDVASALSFKQQLAGLMAPMAFKLEQALPVLESGDGARLLLNLHAIVIGLEQMAPTGPVLKDVLARPELSFLEQDFKTELEQMLVRLLAGWPTKMEDHNGKHSR
ncbi:MAG: TetR family transcriptional regulator [Candidatus Sericytochromatia bacterium]